MSGERIEEALEMILQNGGFDGSHHKQWVLDQVVRILTGCPTITATAKTFGGDVFTYETLGESDAYKRWLASYQFPDGPEGEDYGEWDTGIVP